MDKLASSHSFKVKQEVELFEMLTGWETNNKYAIKDHDGKKVYKAKEHTDACSRQCLGADRPFRIDVEDKDSDKVVMVVRRDYKCHIGGPCCACCDCCKDCITCEAPPGTVIGYVRQEYDGCKASFSVCDASGEVQMRIRGPQFCGCRCPWHKYKFELLSPDGHHEVGKLCKEWGGVAKEMLTDADNFKVEVPKDTDIKLKSVLVGAALLIDFMFFEDNGGGKGHNRVHIGV